MRRRHGVTVVLEPHERMLLAGFADELAGLLAADAGPGNAAGSSDPLERLVGLDSAAVAAPADPALARLLPDAYRDDPDRSAEFRRYSDSDLRRAKREALERLAAGAGADGDISLDADAVETWLQAVNDIRLVIGVRLEITDEGPWSAPEGDPRASLFAVYHWLTHLQEQLIRRAPGPASRPG
jgi:hypothetical protein